MNNIFMWIGYLCFFVAGVQVIRLIKLQKKEKEEINEVNKYRQEAEIWSARIKKLEDEEHKRKIMEERQRKIQNDKESWKIRKKSQMGEKKKENEVKHNDNVKPELWGVRGMYANNCISLKQEIVFGRDFSCNLIFPLDMPCVSRKHCSVKYDSKKGKFCLTDLGSSYGTFRENGEKLQIGESVWLAVNEEFSLGKGERFRVGLQKGA